MGHPAKLPAVEWLVADHVSKLQRSQIMSRIRGKNTRPELIVRSFLHKHGFRYRLHVAALPGKPDILLPKFRTAVFVHGCFWHGHSNCKRSSLPSTRRELWKKKISGNSRRDRRSLSALRSKGWKPIILWECQIGKGEERLHRSLKNLFRMRQCLVH